MVTFESTEASKTAYQFSDAITQWYSESESTSEKAIKWIPAAAGYAVSALYSLIVAVIDIFDLVITKIMYQFAGDEERYAMDRELEVIVSSLKYDFQVFTIGMNGFFSPNTATDIREMYRVKNGLEIASDYVHECANQFTEENQET